MGTIYTFLDGAGRVADRGDEYLAATWPQYESVIAAMGPIGVVTFFGPIMVLMFLIGALVIFYDIAVDIVDAVFTLAEEGMDFLSGRITKRFREAAIQIAWGFAQFILVVLAIPIVLGLAAIGGVVTLLQEKGRIE